VARSVARQQQTNLGLRLCIVNNHLAGLAEVYEDNQIPKTKDALARAAQFYVSIGQHDQAAGCLAQATA
jgi:hypothetical protein